MYHIYLEKQIKSDTLNLGVIKPSPAPPPPRSPRPIGNYTRPTNRLRPPPHQSHKAPARLWSPWFWMKGRQNFGDSAFY